MITSYAAATVAGGATVRGSIATACGALRVPVGGNRSASAAGRAATAAGGGGHGAGAAVQGHPPQASFNVSGSFAIVPFVRHAYAQTGLSALGDTTLWELWAGAPSCTRAAFASLGSTAARDAVLRCANGNSFTSYSPVFAQGAPADWNLCR